MSTFTLEELSNYEKSFKGVIPDGSKPVESPPVQAALPIDSPPVVVTPDAPGDSPPPEAPQGDDVVDPVDPAPPTGAAGADAPAAPRNGARERIEDLVAERNALKKYIEYRDSLEQRGVPVVPAAPAAPVAPVAAPTLESCQYDTDKWTQAMTDWTQQQIAAGVRQTLQSEKQTQTAEASKSQFEERMTAFQQKTPDAKVTFGAPWVGKPLDDGAGQLIVASDIGPQILYHLLKNPDKAARIVRSSPIQQAAAIGRLEVELKAPAPRARTQSQAPPPPEPNRGAAAPVNEATLSVKDFVERERQKLIERRRRH